MRMFTVMGSSEANANIMKMREWFSQLQTYLSSVETDAADDANVSIMAR